MKDNIPVASPTKFCDPDKTADGQDRAFVSLTGLKALWFNTGTLCNIACENCYIQSSPHNDRLVYITSDDVQRYIDEAQAIRAPLTEIGFTGGEPFMNPQMIEMARTALEAGYEVLILTNAMRPMMRKTVRRGLAELIKTYPNRLTLRISLDHWDADFHDKERGKGAFAKSIEGMVWLRDQGARMAVAGRTMWGESETDARQGYARLYSEHGFDIDAFDPGMTVLFPEMDMSEDVPEITTACWDILGKSPRSVMCASSRMIVRHKGADEPSVIACTLLPYEPAFDLGPDLRVAHRDVSLNHPHCAKFCVLGGASCSAE